MYSGSVTEVFTAEQITKCSLIGFLMLNAVSFSTLSDCVFSGSLHPQFYSYGGGQVYIWVSTMYSSMFRCLAIR